MFSLNVSISLLGNGISLRLIIICFLISTWFLTLIWLFVDCRRAELNWRVSGEIHGGGKNNSRVLLRFKNLRFENLKKQMIIIIIII